MRRPLANTTAIPQLTPLCYSFCEFLGLEVTTSTGSRQLSTQVAAALLSKVRAELTSQQAQIVNILKRQCPGFAVMRKLVFGFRAILRGGKVTTCIAGWSRRARRVSIHCCALCGL
jgi:hypothetical protein